METCQNQIIDNSRGVKEITEVFCIIFKEYLKKCPSKCSYFISGIPINLGFIHYKNLEFDCPFLHLIAQITPEDEQSFFCSREGNEPDCSSCVKVKSEKYKFPSFVRD